MWFLRIQTIIHYQNIYVCIWAWGRVYASMTWDTIAPNRVACLLLGAKPLPEQMLPYQANTWTNAALLLIAS